MIGKYLMSDGFILGLDVSKHQGEIKWNKVPTQNYKYCFSRATIGKSTRDTTFKNNYKGARDAGMASGAYHVFWPNRTPEQQRDNLFKAYSPASGDIVPMLDVEVYHSTQSVDAFVDDVERTLELFESEIGKKPFLYTAHWFWEKIGNPRPLIQFPLWVAHYNQSVTEPKLPKGWSDYVIWQYTDEGKVPGITDNTCDLNRFKGTEDDLAGYIQ